MKKIFKIGDIGKANKSIFFKKKLFFSSWIPIFMGMTIVISFFKKHFLHLITVFFWILIIGMYFYYKKISGLSNEQIIKNLYFMLKNEGIYGGLTFIIIYTLRTIIFFPSSLLIIISVSLFGLPLAIFYNILGENLSAVLGFFLGKNFGKNIISHDFLDKFKYLKKGFQENSFVTVLSLRLLFIPFDPLNYICGFFRTKLKGFILGTLFGTLPGILIFIFIGAGIKNIEKFSLSHIKIDHKYMIFSVLITLISLFIVFLLKKGDKKATYARSLAVSSEKPGDFSQK